jgi:hypothetical protein
MDWKYSLLAASGYQILAFSGFYCQACWGEQYVLLRWNGERWLLC